MHKAFPSLLAFWMLAAGNALAQIGAPPLSSVEPVYVEPAQCDPWQCPPMECPAGQCAPIEGNPWQGPPGGDVVLLDEGQFHSLGPGYPEPSPAQLDLGNLIPPGARPGFFQKVNFGAAWMPRFESDGLGITTTRANIVTALPFPKRHQPLVITPEYTVRFFDGPDFIDVPSRVHDVELKFNHIRRIADQWVFNGAVTIGAYADDHSFDASDAVRVSGRALGIYEASPESKWIVGVVYLNRANLSVVPAVGWMYQTDDLKIDLIFPQPKIAWRTWSDGRSGYDERWFFVSGEFGGGIWAVKRADGSDDNLSYSDYRLLVGTERKLVGGLSRVWEFGYVFGRELEYDTVAADIDIDDTVFVRAGFTY